MAAKLTDKEYDLLERLSETYALPSSPHHLDPVAFNRYVRSRIPPRGARFTHDHRDTCAYIARSKNLNVVAYTANFVAAAPPAESSPEGAPSAPSAAEYPQHHHSTSAQKTHYLPAGKVFVESGRRARCSFNAANAIHPYFINLEPSYLAARRKKGIVGDCDDLKMLERRFAYGYNTKAVDTAAHIVTGLPGHMNHDSPLYAALAGAGAEEARQALLADVAEWWGAFEPMMSTFVALPVWPAMLLRLPPLTTATTDGEEEGGKWCCDSDTVAVIIAVIAGELCVLEKVYVKSIERWLRLPSVEYIEVFGVRLADGEPAYEKQANNGQYDAPAELTKEEMAEMNEN